MASLDVENAFVLLLDSSRTWRQSKFESHVAVPNSAFVRDNSPNTIEDETQSGIRTCICVRNVSALRFTCCFVIVACRQEFRCCLIDYYVPHGCMIRSMVISDLQKASTKQQRSKPTSDAVYRILGYSRLRQICKSMRKASSFAFSPSKASAHMILFAASNLLPLCSRHSTN